MKPLQCLAQGNLRLFLLTYITKELRAKHLGLKVLFALTFIQCSIGCCGRVGNNFPRLPPLSRHYHCRS